jgi:nitrite reductase/ring-hydroxylating ferredoxin subunit
MAWRWVCHEGDLPERGGIEVVVDGRHIAVFRAPSGLWALDNACRHTGAPLHHGTIEGSCLRCPWHGWRYHLGTGAHLTLFGSRPGVRTWPVRVVDGEVELDVG